MSHFINARERIVTEAIDAEIALSNGALTRLDGYPAIKVVVRADWTRDGGKVAIVSGGGAGHEPAHVGFVGDGMLTAAVSGEIFASPSVDAVLAAILEVTGDAGCLLVVKNYTGDRLNFGLAAERARALGLSVQMVIVSDDIALPDAPRPRGIAGTLLVHKVAGHFARAGAPLGEVQAVAERVARGVVSIGVSVSSCTIPGQSPSNRIGASEVELGLGIHGEPGARIVALPLVRDLGREMMDLLKGALAKRHDGAAHASGPLALVVNDLGGVPPIEMALAAHAAVHAAPPHDVRLVFGPARLMTSLDMKGFSISALALGESAIEDALVSPVGPRAWPIARTPRAVAPRPLPLALRSREVTPSTHGGRRQALERICAALVAKQADLDALDAKIGDGDTGTTFATAARALAADIDRLPFADLAELFAVISERLGRVMGGTSGILLAIWCAAVGAHIEGAAARGGASTLANAGRAGVERMQAYGGARLGDRTMLDALIPALAALGEDENRAAAAVAAAEGAERTKHIAVATAGRASYVPKESLVGVADPGAVAVAIVFAALAE